MTSERMPLMLHNSMPVELNDVDDLFGDGVGLSLNVPPPQVKQLLQRTDEQRTRGCCQAVAWSRIGTIASITPDGQEIELRSLRCSPEDGTWDLSEPTTCQSVKGTLANPLVHLEWSSTGSPDLAVIDSVGRVAILPFSQYLNQPFQSRKWDSDPVDDMHSVVGCHWLWVALVTPQKPYNVLYGPAVREGNMYRYESSFVNAGGLSHPNPTRSALFCVTAGGMLKMFWAQVNNKIEETTIELESVNASDDLVTHSAMVSDKKSLLVAIATTSKQLRLVKVDVQWGNNPQLEKTAPPQPTRLNPSFTETHLATTNWLHSGPSDASQDLSLAELSHLHILPTLMDNTGKNMVPPTILAVRSRTPGQGSFEMTQSIIGRWEVVEEKEDLHQAFEQPGSRRNSMPETPKAFKLHPLEPILVNKVCIGFQTMQFGKVLLFTYADGTVEYRDRFTFEEIYTVEDTDRVAHLRQAGWSFTDNGPCQQIAFSPTFCSMVQMSDDGKLRWSRLHYPAGDIGNSMQDTHYGASIAGLVIAAASAMYHQANYDDMLAIVQPFVSKRKFAQDWIAEIIRILKIQVDYSEDTSHEIMRNSQLQSCLSIMNTLGFRGELQPRSSQSRFSMLSMNVRNIVMLISLSVNTSIVREKMTPLDEHEVVEVVTDCVKWSMDLLAWFADCLFELANDEQFRERLVPQKIGELARYLHEKNDVSLQMLLSSSSRTFLMAMCRRIVHLESLSVRAIEFYRKQSAMAESAAPGKAVNPQSQQAYQRMQYVISQGLVKVTELENLLGSVTNDVRQAYQNFLPIYVKQQAKPPQGKDIDIAMKTAKIQIELSMLLSGSPSPPFIPVIHKFFSKDLQAFRKLTDPAKLFFANYDLLEVQDDKHSLANKQVKGTYIDVFKRTEIQRSSTQVWRRCTRCAAVMEDMHGTRPGLTFVLNQQRRCSCGGSWLLLPKGKLLL